MQHNHEIQGSCSLFAVDLLKQYIQWNLTTKTTYGTCQNSLNIEVVSILNPYFSETNIGFSCQNG